MTKMRAVLVGLTAASLLGLPAAALGTTPVTGLQQAAARHHTSIRWMVFDHMRPAGYTATIVGQVTGRAHREQGALAGVPVKLFRQLGAGTSWVYLGTKMTDRGAAPQFRFATLSRQNARYKVVYAGNESFEPASKTTWLDVYRLFHGHITDGPQVATLKGNVTPYYTHKAITLQKRSCATCQYVNYKSGVTGVNGAYSYQLPAPPTGRWWWRVTTPGNPAFIKSYGGTFSTQRL